MNLEEITQLGFDSSFDFKIVRVNAYSTKVMENDIKIAISISIKELIKQSESIATANPKMSASDLVKELKKLI